MMRRFKEIAIAFLAALLLWSLATSQNLSKVNFFVNLSITEIPEDYIISERYDNTVNIRAAGPESILSKLTSYDFSAVYKMPDIVKPGDFSFKIDPTDIDGPSGVEVESVSPSLIRIYLDRTVKKTLDIKLDIVGEPADGYKVAGYELFPSKVIVNGPQKIMDKLTEIKTESPFDVTGLDGPYRQKLNLVINNKNVTFIDTQYTIIEVIVEPIIITKRLEDISVTTYPVELKTKLIPETFTADFRGPKNIIEKVIQPGIIAVIDIRDYNVGLKYLLSPGFPELPPEIQVVDRNPKKITVKILKEN